MVEVYSESWGPCSAIIPTLKKFKLDKDPDPTCVKSVQVRFSYFFRESTFSAPPLATSRAGLLAATQRPCAPPTAAGTPRPRALQCKAEKNELLKQFANQSTPRFLFYRNGVLPQRSPAPRCVACPAQGGARLARHVGLPRQAVCAACCLVAGTLKETIVGPNAPAIYKTLMTLTPNNVDADEPDVRPCRRLFPTLRYFG